MTRLEMPLMGSFPMPPHWMHYGSLRVVQPYCLLLVHVSPPQDSPSP